MTVETGRAERALNDAFLRFKQSHAEFTLAVAAMKLSLSERRVARPVSVEVANGKLAPSMTEGRSDGRSRAPGSPSASLIPTVDLLE